MPVTDEEAEAVLTEFLGGQEREEVKSKTSPMVRHFWAPLQKGGA